MHTSIFVFPPIWYRTYPAASFQCNPLNLTHSLAFYIHCPISSSSNLFKTTLLISFFCNSTHWFLIFHYATNTLPVKITNTNQVLWYDGSLRIVYRCHQCCLAILNKNNLLFWLLETLMIMIWFCELVFIYEYSALHNILVHIFFVVDHWYSSSLIIGRCIFWV